MSKAAELVIREAATAWLAADEARIACERAEDVERRAVKTLATKSRALWRLLKKAGGQSPVVCQTDDRFYLLTTIKDQVEIRPVETVTAGSISTSIQERERSRERK